MEKIDLPVIPDIELVEQPKKAELNGEKTSALQYFCTGWAMLLPGILIAIEQIKWPWWKWAAQLGVSVVNQIHSKICPVTPL